MPIGKSLDAHDQFRMALGIYYKKERDRTEECLGQIVNILGSSDVESKQVEQILQALTDHYARKAN